MESYKLQCTAGQQSRAAVPSYTLFSTHYSYIHRVENGGKTRGKQITSELVSVAYII